MSAIQGSSAMVGLLYWRCGSRPGGDVLPWLWWLSRLSLPVLSLHGPGIVYGLQAGIFLPKDMNVQRRCT